MWFSDHVILKSSRNVAGFALDRQRDVSTRKRGKMRGREEMLAIFSFARRKVVHLLC